METTSRPSVPGQLHATAGLLVDAIAAQDFPQIAAALDPDAVLSALLPRGFDEWRGAAEICGAFERWFGGLEPFDVVDSSIGCFGPLVQMRWRLRVAGGRFGTTPMLVEQRAHATAGPTGRIAHVSLLCTGFWPEHEATNRSTG